MASMPAIFASKVKKRATSVKTGAIRFEMMKIHIANQRQLAAEPLPFGLIFKKFMSASIIILHRLVRCWFLCALFGRVGF